MSLVYFDISWRTPGDLVWNRSSVSIGELNGGLFFSSNQIFPYIHVWSHLKLYSLLWLFILLQGVILKKNWKLIIILSVKKNFASSAVLANIGEV
jgi:hypothetical protein